MTTRGRPQTPGKRAKKPFTEAEIEAARKAYAEKPTVDHVRRVLHMGHDRTYELLSMLFGICG